MGTDWKDWRILGACLGWTMAETKARLCSLSRPVDQVMKKQKRKLPVSGFEWVQDNWKNSEALQVIRKRATEHMKKRLAIERKRVRDYMLCPNIRKRLLRRWKGTALEVKTLCWGPMQRDDEIGGKEMDAWLDDVVRGRVVPAPTFSMETAPRST